MARLLSVNVGLPREIAWHGRVVRTGIWKEPVADRTRVGRLNIEGDGQGDLNGHGGEQRAVLVYQIESYRYWEARLRRDGFTLGQFGENFTIEGLPDDEARIGDRYRIGTALFEVTQPRTTCYRVGIRMDEPQMAALLTSSGRPGFYLRVLEEGEIGAGDPIIPVAQGPQAMTVAEINALLYSSNHPRDRLERALKIAALSPGWRWSFEELLRDQDTHPGATRNAALVPVAATRPAAPGFRALRVSRVDRECADVISLSLAPTDERPLTAALAGQFVVLRLRPTPDAPPLFRSYSLSGEASDQRYRVSIKIEPGGAAGSYLKDIRVGDVLDVSEPRGAFTLQPGDGPVVFISGGIGATPVLAMLHALSASASPRPIWWLHGARNGQSHSFAAEVRQLVGKLAHGHSHVCYSQPGADDRQGQDYDAMGRLGTKDFQALRIPREGDFYLCGPSSFLSELTLGLAAWGAPAERVHAEVFSGGPSLTPGVVSGPTGEPHLPEGPPGAGPSVSFARSGLTVRWRPSQDQSLLELAEACDVPVRWSCRTGICHNCEVGLVSGTVAYQPDPMDPPVAGNVLICCSRPQEDVVIDL